MTKLFFIIAMLTALMLPAEAAEPQIVQVVKSDNNNEIDIDDFESLPEIGPKRRNGVKTITCTITRDGIDIPGVASEDIYLYEVRSEEGECMASFASESEFIAYIYACEETVEIRIHTTDGFVLRGYLYR